jgi:hypothetical protein
MKRTSLAVLAVSALALSGISTVNATTFNNLTGLPGVGITPISTVTFDGVLFTQDTVITNQFSFKGINLSPNMYYDGNNPYGACNFSDESGDCLSSYPSALTPVVTPFSIFFNTSQMAAAFALVTSTSSETVITALRNGTIVDQMTVSTGSSPAANIPNFFGFYNEAGGFNQITVSVGGGGSSSFAIIDNVQLTAPEPGTIGLLGLGVSGLVYAARRRRRSA